MQAHQRAGTEREAPAKATLRALLTHNAPRMGLTAAATEQLVRQSHITHWRAGQQIFAQGDAHDLVSFLVAGAVRVVCQGQRAEPITVQVVRPGQFLGLASPFDPPGPRLFGAVAHVDAIVAVLSHETLIGVMETLPPRKALQLMAYTWRALSRLLYEKSLLLTMPLSARVVYVLAQLAQDFGVPHPGGVQIDLPLTQADVAEFVAGARANVSRCFASLRRAGQLEVRRRRIVLSRSFPARKRTVLPGT
jgi:CRP/FNR family cyclic AMP-dependent transcriptional regulator